MMNPNKQMIEFLATDRIGAFKHEAAGRKLARQAQSSGAQRGKPNSKRRTLILVALVNRIFGVR